MTRLLPLFKIHNYGNHAGEADVFKSLGRQRRTPARLALHIDLAAHIHV